MQTTFDLVVIGSGPGGYRAAVLAKLRGMENVAIVEEASWGGCCLNRGCVPKKDWHHTAKLIAEVNRGFSRGLMGRVQGDLDMAWQHQHEVVTLIRENYVDYMKRSGIAAFQGTASFVSPHTIRVGDELLDTKQVIVATGATARVPEPFSRQPGRILTTDDLFDAPPPSGRRVAILGSGVIGTEFAFILHQLGCQIVWLANTEPLSHTEFSPAALNLLEEAFEPLNIPRLPRPQRVEVLSNGVRLDFVDGRQEVVDWVLLGAGRQPNTDGLNLALAEVETDERGFIKVNAYRQTNVGHIYAIGDVANHKMTANHALADADLAVANILHPRSRAIELDTVPELVYSALELGRIGLSEDAAIDAGFEPAVGFAAFETNPRAAGQDETDGFVRLVADMDSSQLLGAEVIGVEAGEIIHVIGTQLGHDDALQRFATTFFNHPARAEEIRNATETLAAKWGLSEQVFGS